MCKIKIVHLCLSNFYIDNFGYQENLLPKYHHKMGHDVTIIASRFTYRCDNGQPDIAEEGEYMNSDGIRVKRISYRYKWLGSVINDKIKIYKGTYSHLRIENPNVIFCHGIQFIDLAEVVRYCIDNPSCTLIADNHAAYINSGLNRFSRLLLHKGLYRFYIKRALPHIEVVYMLAPGCMDFAKDMYNIPQDKMAFLYLGADTEKIDFRRQAEVKTRIRDSLDIGEGDFVLITGGKLSREKNMELLFQAIKKIEDTRLKLIVFGSFSEDISLEMIKFVHADSRIKHIGWIHGDDVYDYYLASDVAVFPGTKSALWEQAICSGLPIICRRWPGMDYVDIGGNCLFLDGDDEGNLAEQILVLNQNRELLEKMTTVARSEGFKTFSYEKIASMSLSRVKMTSLY